MEKQKMEERTMEENNKKNPDNERKSKLVSAVLMAFVCILMMGGGTYAWFTMSNTAKVTCLKLNVKSEGSLYISDKNDFNTTKKSEMTWPDDTNNKILYPCTTPDGIDMYKPIYASETVVDSFEAVDDEEKEMYYLEQDFYLLMDEGDNDTSTNETYDVCLVKKGATNGEGVADGTYFSAENGGLCTRVSFLLDGANTDTVVVYEPNSNGTISGTVTSATDSNTQGKVETTYKQNTEGVFLNGSGNEIGDSESLFQITGDTPTLVKVKVWFEGKDEQCVNEIILEEIEGQLKFVTKKPVGTP